jgi:ABC-type Fe3+ transport system substrate-binding protein
MNSGLSALEAGQVSLSIVTTDTMLVARHNGAPVDVAPVSPVYAGTFGLYVPRSAPHAAAAELLVDYLTSPAGRALFERTSYHALVTPCPVSTTAAYLCSHHVKPVIAGTLADMKAEPGWLVTVEKALGTYK